MSHIDSAFSESTLEGTIKKIKGNFNALKEIENNWDTDWIKLCDGKIVFYEHLNIVSQETLLQPKRVIFELLNIAYEDKRFEINRIVNRILEILK